MIFILIFILSIYSLSKAIADYESITNGIIINHFKGAVATIFVCIVLSIPYTGFNAIKILITTSILLNIHWILFDIMLNKIRNLPINYIGRSAYSDKLLRKLGIKNILIPKLVSLAILLSLAYYIFNSFNS